MITCKVRRIVAYNSEEFNHPDMPEDQLYCDRPAEMFVRFDHGIISLCLRHRVSKDSGFPEVTEGDYLVELVINS